MNRQKREALNKLKNLAKLRVGNPHSDPSIPEGYGYVNDKINKRAGIVLPPTKIPNQPVVQDNGQSNIQNVEFSVTFLVPFDVKLQDYMARLIIASGKIATIEYTIKTTNFVLPDGV